MEKFREALKHSDIVKVVLTGVGETCFSTGGISKCIEELERLARIGEATEKAYKCGFKMTKGQEITDGFRYEYIRDDEFETIEELLTSVESEE